MTNDVDAQLNRLPPSARAKARQALTDAARWGAQLDYLDVKPHGDGYYVTLHFTGGSFWSSWLRADDDKLEGGAT